MTARGHRPASRIYRRLIALLPRHLVERHGDEMTAMFLLALDQSHPSGRWATAGVWARAIGDIAQTIVHQAVRRQRQRGQVGPPPNRHAVMFTSDIRAAWRSLVRQKFATGLAIGMLALGIAASVAVFTLVNGIFLRPFPVPDAHRLVYINEAAPKWNLEYVGVNYPDFDQWRKGQRLFEALALHDTATFNLADGASVERVDGAMITRDFFDVLRMPPLIGRSFTAEEDRPNGTPAVMISEALWRERFHADPAVIGRPLRLDSAPRTIVGVVSARADFGFRARVWVPLRGDPAQTYQNYSWTGIGRLKPGVTVADADKDLRRAHQPIWDARDKDRVVSPFVRDMRAELTRDFDTIALALGAAVGILLLVACANVASVMLARALNRRREMGIRLAIGASRTRLLRQLFVENVLLAVAGGALGLVLGGWALDTLIRAAGDQVPRWAAFDLDWRVMAFSVGLAAVTVILFGWAPAFHALRGDLRAAMQTTTTGTTAAPAGRRTLGMLVAAEFALAAMLLVCGGLLYRAYDRVRTVDPGFEPEHVLTFTVFLPDAKYPNDKARSAFWDRLAPAMAALPGVEAAGLVNCPPLGCHWGNFFDVEGRVKRANEDMPVTLVRVASPSYARAMGLRVVRGRFIEPSDDRPYAPKDGGVVVVNEMFARTFWPNVADPVGRRLRGNDDTDPWITVIGVVADVKHYGLERPMRPGVYFPLKRRAVGNVTVALRTTGEPLAATASARAAVNSLDPELPLYRVRSMRQALHQSMEMRLAYSWLLGVFAVLAVLLAVGGGYGVTSFLAAQRTREMGIRIALGAQVGDILRAVLSGSLVLAAGGVAVGLLASLGASKLLASLLFGVSPHDALVLGGTGVILVLAAIVANLWPARRAARVDTVGLLRSE